MSEIIAAGSWPEIHEVVKRASRFVVSSHINPDGDAVGSALALKRILEKLGKDVWWVMDKPMHHSYDSFYRPDELKVFENSDCDFSSREVAVITDAGFWKRIGDVGEALARMPGDKICIDHHPAYDDFPGARIIDTASPSTTVMIYRYLKFLELELTLDIAEPIYLGMIVDTQNFHLPNTTPDTHRIAAECLEAGVNPSQVHEPVFGTNRFSRLRLMSDLVQSAEVLFDGKVCIMHTSIDMFEKAGSEFGDDEGFSDLTRTIDGVSIGIYMREEERGKKVKVSWRASGDNNVAVSARHFGGGGHIRAAGAHISGTLEDVRKKVIAHMQERYENGEIQ